MVRAQTICAVAVLLAVGALLAPAVAVATPQTFTVTGFTDTTSGSCNGTGTVCPSLRDAVAAANANPGSTIELQAGTFTLTHSDLSLAPQVTISGAGPGGATGTTIEQETTGSNSVIEVIGGSGAVALDGIEITGGHVTEGAGIFAPSPGVRLSLSHDLIEGNTAGPTDGFTGSPAGFAGQGGGVYSTGTLQLTDTDVVNDHALGGAGLSIESPTQASGGAGGDGEGGGIYATGATTITGGRFAGNSAVGGAGGLGNGTGSTGGAGGAGQGGAIFISGAGQLTATSATFANNTANGGTGGFDQGGTGDGSSSAGVGGAINSAGTLTLNGVTVTSNEAGGGNGNGSGVPTTGGGGQGGGIGVSGDATIADSTIAANTATGGQGGQNGGIGNDVGGAGGGSQGGGIFTSSLFGFTVRASTVSGNTAAGGAGGLKPPPGCSCAGSNGPDGAATAGGIFHQSGTVFITNQKTPIVVNSTISDNSATSGSAASGGALATVGVLGVQLGSDTVAGNTASHADSLYSVPGAATSSFTVGDTILAANPSGGAVNCAASVTDAGRNLEDSGATSTCGLSSASHDVLVAPGASGVASALASNGGPTQTLALSASSPAIGAGGACTDPANNGAALTTDQRGLPRAATCDIGAFEHQPPASTARPSITGTPAVGDTLTCGRATFSGDGPPTVAFQWLRNGSPITSARAARYTVQHADAGHTLTCKVTATGTYGTASATTAPVGVPSPQSGTPTIHSQTDTVAAKGATTVKVGCRGPGSCQGSLQLIVTVTTHRHHKTQHHRVTIATAGFTIAAGRITAVAVRLNGTGRRLLGAATGGKLHLTITVNSGKRLTGSAKGMLRLAPKRKHPH